MDSNIRSSLPDSSDAKAAFHKPSNDASNRQYRRRSPVSGLSSSEGTSPRRDRNISPIVSRDDLEKRADTRLGRDVKELDRDSSRNQYGIDGDSHRYSDRQSSRSSHGYSRHDDYVRHDKRADENSKYDRFSSRSDPDSRISTHSGHQRQSSDLSRSKDYSQNADKYSRDRYDGSGHRSRVKEKESPSLERHKYKDKDSSFDRVSYGRRLGNTISEETDRDGRWDKDGRDEKVGYHRSSRDKKGEYTSYEETRGNRNDTSSARERDNERRRPKEGHRSGPEDLDGLMLSEKERMRYDDGEINVEKKDRYSRVRKGQYEEKSIFDSKNQESPVKKSKLFSLDDEKRPNFEETVERVTMGQVHGSDAHISNDLNAAKVAAMKAAELVNRNLIGAGHSNMTTEQKKKLLWGSKKTTPVEESGHRWDTALFGDRERQEKFNKLMSEVALVPMPIVGCKRGCEGGAENRQSRCREAAGTPAGFGEAVYCWTSAKGWSHCWIGSLNIKVGNLWCCQGECSVTFCATVLFCTRHTMHFEENCALLDVSGLGRRLLTFLVFNIINIISTQSLWY